MVLSNNTLSERNNPLWTKKLKQFFLKNVTKILSSQWFNFSFEIIKIYQCDSRNIFYVLNSKSFRTSMLIASDAFKAFQLQNQIIWTLISQHSEFMNIKVVHFYPCLYNVIIEVLAWKSLLSGIDNIYLFTGNILW